MLINKSSLLKKLKILAFLPVFLISSCSRTPFYDSKNIEYEELKQKEENKEEFIFVLYSNDCVHCHDVEKDIKNYFSNSETPLYTIEVENLTKGEKIEFLSIQKEVYVKNYCNYSYPYITEENFFTSPVTPTFLYSKKNEGFIDIRFGVEDTIEILFQDMMGDHPVCSN